MGASTVADPDTYYAGWWMSERPSIDWNPNNPEVFSFPIGSRVVVHTTRPASGNVGYCILGSLMYIPAPHYETTSINAYGTQSGWIGNLDEVILYSRVLSAREIQSVKWYLALKWQAPVS
jgi:hypothetical protein